MNVSSVKRPIDVKNLQDTLRPSLQMAREQPQSIPDWLLRASDDDRQFYYASEQALARAEKTLDQQLGEIKSLKDFAHYHAREVVKVLSGKVVDPDQIFVAARHTFFIAEQKVVHRNRLNLPEFMLNGLYDPASYPLEITLEGESLPPELTAEELLEIIGDTSMRAVYPSKFREKYAKQEVLLALQAELKARIDLSVFSGKLQGHVSDQSLNIVMSAMGHAEGYSVGEMLFSGWEKPFQGLIVYCGPEGEAGPCVLYAPHGPGGKAWYEFATIRQLNIHMVDWVRLPEGRHYLSRQTHASERTKTEAYMRLILNLPSQWAGIERNQWLVSPAGALRQGVLINVDWLKGEMDAVTPPGYGAASSYHRQYFARLNTELKALTRLVSHEAGFISYEKFAFNLVKKLAEDLLAENGETVSINPDLIMVEVNASLSMTLTQLIIKEHHITEESGPEHNPGVYPRIRLLPGHPALPELLSKYIVGWSKTLRPGEKYIDMLRSDYLDRKAPDYNFRRDVYVNLQLHQMQRAALAELFSGLLARTDYERLEQAIDRLRTPEPSDPIAVDYPDSPQRDGVYAFHLEHRKIQGVYVFRTVSNGHTKDWLYTPHAPDDRGFRPMSEFSKSVKTGGLGAYYWKRAGFTEQLVVRTYIDKVMNSSVDIAPQALQINSRVFDFSSAYQNMLVGIIKEVDAQTSSLVEIIAKLSYDAAVAAVAVIGCVIPPVGLGLSSVVMAKGVLEGALAYREGDNVKAFSSFLDCMLELATLGIGKVGFSQAQRLIAKQLGDVNTCMSAVSACTGTTADLAVVTELMKQALAEPESGEKTLLE